MPRFESSYENFVGGLNTVSANEALANSEFPELKNIELGDRGSLKRRHGMKMYYEPSVKGKGQGFFRLFRKERTPIEIYAIKGNLYTKPWDGIELNESLEWVYVSKHEGYQVIKVNVPNALPGSSLDVTNKMGIIYENVTEITAAYQVMMDLNKDIHISLPDSETGWTAEPDLIAMKLFMKNVKLLVSYNLPKELIDIEGLPNGFQADRPIEAIQYRDKMYFATGTKLIQYDGVSAKVVEPHKPEPLEALFIGTNALADDPANFMTDGTSEVLRIDGVTSDRRLGIINQTSVIKTYISKPATITTVEYQYKYRKVGADAWTIGKDWSTAKEYTFTPSEIGDYELDIYARKQGDTTSTPARFIVPKYKVYETDKNEKVDFKAIHRCNRILLHWERIIMYGDDLNSGHIFVSNLRQPDYFPTANTLFFESREIEPLTALVRYRDMLVAFTPNSIQALYGKSPEEYFRVTLNTEIGCIAPYSAQVTGNLITFLSAAGVYILDSVGVTEERANVTRIDTKISNIINKDEDACALVSDSQYHLYFPSRKKRLRLYFEQGGAWTKDESEKMDFSSVKEWDGIIYGQSIATGRIMRFDKEEWTDDGYVYEALIETKEFDFGKPYDKKKIKQVKLLLETFEQVVNLSVYVYADTSLIINPDVSHATVTADGEVIWRNQSEPNISLKAGSVLGSWEMGADSLGKKDSEVMFLRVSGRCRRTKIIISHQEATPNSLLGFGYVFVMTEDR